MIEDRTRRIAENHLVFRILTLFKTRIASQQPKINGHLRLIDTQLFEQLRMFDGQFDDLLDLFDLLVQPAHHVVRRVWHFLDHHHAYQGVDLKEIKWQNFIFFGKIVGLICLAAAVWSPRRSVCVRQASEIECPKDKQM